MFFRIKIKYELKINNYNFKYLRSRVNYYNKIVENFKLGEDAVNLDTLFNLQIEKFINKILKKIKKRTTYFLKPMAYHIFPSF